MSSSAISITRLKKYFSPRTIWGAATSACVLDDVSLEIAPGEIFGLLGGNGAGKTTLMDILATHLLPTSGAARICGRDVVSEAHAVRFLAGYCPASADSFYPRLSTLANLEFFATLYDLDLPTARERVRQLIELVGLSGVAHRSFQQLSLGMKQRVGLARALLTDPPVLLLDEPTRSLDPTMQREIQRFLRESIQGKLGKTVLLVTHSLAEVSALCNRMAILSRGRIAVCGTQREVLEAAGADELDSAYAHFTGHSINVDEDASAAVGGGRR